MEKKYIPNGSRLSDDWISPRRAAQLIGCSTSHLWGRIVPSLAPSEARKLGGRRLFDPSALVRVRMNQLAARLAPADGDPLLMEAGGASSSRSPALERYRAEKALLAKMEREEKQGELIPRDLIRRGFTVAANLIREAGEMLMRDFGPAAADVLNRALDDAERETNTVFGKEKKR